MVISIGEAIAADRDIKINTRTRRFETSHLDRRRDNSRFLRQYFTANKKRSTTWRECDFLLAPIVWTHPFISGLITKCHPQVRRGVNPTTARRFPGKKFTAWAGNKYFSSENSGGNLHYPQGRFFLVAAFVRRRRVVLSCTTPSISLYYFLRDAKHTALLTNILSSRQQGQPSLKTRSHKLLRW